jgi:MFS family permease
MNNSPLKNSIYRKLFAAQIIALTGTGLSTIALALLAYGIAGESSGMVLGIALALKMAAYVIFAPIIGGVAHRLPRKRLLIAMDLIRAILLFLLPWVDAIWQIYLIIFIISICSATFKPVYQAIIPDVLTDKQQYTKALSMFRIAYDMENILSPTLAALLLMVASFNGLFLLNSLAFLLSAFLIIFTNLPKQKTAERTGSTLDEISFGLKAYLATPRLRGLLALYVGVAAASSMVIVNTAVYVQGSLRKTEIDTALALLALGVGSILTAVLIPRLLEKTRERTVMLTGGWLLAVAMGLGTLAPSYTTLLILWLLLGVGLSLAQTPSGRLINESCQAGDRTSLFSANFSLTHGCWFFAYLLAGYLSSSIGVPQTFFTMTLLIISALLAAHYLWPQQEPSKMEHNHAAINHNHVHSHDDPHHTHDHTAQEGDKNPSHPHSHQHHHPQTKHSHHFIIDMHHPSWPNYS